VTGPGATTGSAAGVPAAGVPAAGAPAAPDRLGGRSSRPRRRLLVLLGVLALLGAALAVGARDQQAPPPLATGPDAAELAALREAAGLPGCPPGLGPDLPHVGLPGLAGGPDVRASAGTAGRPTVVNVWASWCGPCVREVPLLAAFAERAGDRVDLVGVLTQDSLRSALAFAQASGMDWPSLVDDDGTVMRAFSPAPPVTLFVTPEGRVAHVERGEFSDLAEIEALAAEHLGVQL
jgi:cytochrome c biogenesis protein CcmG, thiol:disulfide interchange protein DsbE